MNLQRINCTFSSESLIQNSFSFKNDRHLCSQRNIVVLLTNGLKLVLIFVNSAIQGCVVQRGGKVKILALGQRLVFREKERVLIVRFLVSWIAIMISQSLDIGIALSFTGYSVNIQPSESNTFTTMAMDINAMF